MSSDSFEKYKEGRAYFLKDESEEASLKLVDSRIQELVSNRSRRLRLRWLSIAAVVLLIVVAGWVWMLGGSSGVSLAQSYFEAYPNYQTTASRGADNSSQLTNAYKAYDDEAYEIAAREFKAPDILSPVDGLYYAIALESLSEWDVSLRMLYRIRAELPEEYAVAGDWYLALALVALEKKEEAKPILKNIAEGQSVFAVTAEKLLKKI